MELKEANILIITSGAYSNDNNKWLGSVKDIFQRARIIESLGGKVDFIFVPGRSDLRALKILRSRDLSNVSAVIFEHTRWPKSLKYLKFQYPKIIRLVRAHNAECMHSIDRIMAAIRVFGVSLFFSPKYTISIVCLPFITLFRDFSCCRSADKMLICNESEIDDYWKFFKKRKSLIAVNTVTELSDKVKVKSLDSKIRVIHIGSVLPTEFNDHSLFILQRELSMNHDSPSNENIIYSITGEYNYRGLDLLYNNVNFLGVVEDLFPVMIDNDIVIILSQYGRGIKTRIYESLKLGNSVVTHETVWKRLPLILQKHVHPWDGKKGTLISKINLVSSLDSNDSLESDLYEFQESSMKNLIKSIAIA